MSRRTLRVLACLTLSSACLLAASHARAGWSTDPVQVHASTAHIPQVSAVDDGHTGAIVVWQEDAASGSMLLAQHLLPTGDVDPAWPSTGLLVSPRDVNRSAIGAVTDDAGGAYVWWREGTSLYLSRITAAGQVGAGWPTTGRFLTTLFRPTDEPVVLPDHQGGVFVGWLAYSQFPVSDPTGTVRVVRYGPGNVAATGWPAGGRALGNIGLTNPTVISFDMDVTTNGNLWLAWTMVDKGPQLSALAGEHRVVSLAPNGQPGAGWTYAGILLDTFDGSLLNTPGWLGYLPTAMRFVAVARDGGSGAFVLTQSGTYLSPDVAYSVAIHRVGINDGSNFGNPPPVLISNFSTATGDPGFVPSARLLPDGRGGIYLGLAEFYTEFVSLMRFQQYDGLGGLGSGSVLSDQSGFEAAAADGGGMFVAAYKSSGATQPNESDAYVRVAQTNGPSFVESHPSFYSERYSAIGLAALRGGGALLAWAEAIDRHGVFAIRLGPAGQVTGVPPVSIAANLRAHFARGRGVLAQVAVPGALEADLALLDVQGRLQSTLRAVSNSALEATFPGTAALSPGIYFVRASGAGQQLIRRVVVVR